MLLKRYVNSSLEPSAQVERVAKKSKNKINKSVPDNRQRKKERKKERTKEKTQTKTKMSGSRKLSCPPPLSPEKRLRF